MKRYYRLLCIMLFVILVAGLNLPMAIAGEPAKTITILFTHDLHDHVLPSNVTQNGQVTQLGGYARLKTEIDSEKSQNPDSILVDAGDFSMGTLFQSIYASDAPELRLMGQMGYQVTTFGNHEFDFRPKGLADSLHAAKMSGDKLPQIVASNIVFPTDANGRLKPSLANLKNAMQNYGVKDYTIIEQNGVKIGIFGLVGQNAADDAPMAEVKFTDMIESAKRVVKVLKEKEKVDLIVCLSHSGTSPDKSKSEDEILARKVPEINVIISGHTHTKLVHPIVVGQTIIGSVGCYGEYLGVIHLSQDASGSWKLNQYDLEEINRSIVPDPLMEERINRYKNIVQQKYLDRFGMKFDQVLADSSFHFVPVQDLESKHAEDPLGDLISDAYIYGVKKAEGSHYDPVAISIVPAGTVRDSIVRGKVTVADAFAITSLGIGPDGIPGYPLISCYLTGKELQTVAEVDASIAPIISDAQLYASGLSYRFNPNRLIFNKVMNVQLQHPDGTLEQIDDTKLYRVVADLYTAQMLSIVGKKSYGMLSIVPKKKDGTPVTNFEAQMITDKTGGSNHELKAWIALADYLSSFPKVNGISQIPLYYSETHARKIVDTSHNPFVLISHPNRIAIAVYAIILIVILMFAFAIFMLATRKKRKDKHRARMAKQENTKSI